MAGHVFALVTWCLQNDSRILPGNTLTAVVVHSGEWERSDRFPSASLAAAGPVRDPRPRRRKVRSPARAARNDDGRGAHRCSCSAPSGRASTGLSCPTPHCSPLTIVEIQRRVGEELDRIRSVIDELGALFSDAGEALALVGGPVRDAMIGGLQNDLDFTTSARPDVTERLVSALGRRRVGHGPRLRHDRLPQGTVAGRE